MGRHESFNPEPKNILARAEENERLALKIHNEGLHDEAPKNATIDESTGQTFKPSTEVGGVDEERTERMVKRGKSGDIMGSVAGTLPTDDAALLQWIAKEKAKLEKKKGLARKQTKEAA